MFQTPSCEQIAEFADDVEVQNTLKQMRETISHDLLLNTIKEVNEDLEATSYIAVEAFQPAIQRLQKLGLNPQQIKSLLRLEIKLIQRIQPAPRKNLVQVKKKKKVVKLQYHQKII